MKVIFMGTPDYAVATLEALIAAGHEVAAVFAQPDKPVGRKRILTAPPVKVCAEKHGIPVFQPQTLKGEETEKQIKAIAPEGIVVVAYGKLLPETILSIPKYGCINGHASLLPAYRGASPIQWCIVCGETKTGVTIMQMDKGMDTGDILKVKEVEIGETETAEELFERLSCVTATLMVSTLRELQEGKITPRKQPTEGVSYAPIIKKEMAELRFGEYTAKEICNRVRGYYSWPCAYFLLEGKRVKVLSAEESGKTEKVPGTVLESGKEWVIACKDGTSVSLLTVQPEGSKPMTAGQMLCGKPIAVGIVIGDG